MRRPVHCGILFVFLMFAFVSVNQADMRRAPDGKVFERTGERFYSIHPPLASYSTSDFDVTYLNFPDEAMEAFEYAVSIWESLLISDVPVRIHAIYAELPGLLGTTFPNLAKHFENPPIPDVHYPAALADAISGFDLNDGEFDMNVYMSMADDWYFGTDGRPPDAEWDLPVFNVDEWTVAEKENDFDEMICI